MQAILSTMGMLTVKPLKTRHDANNHTSKLPGMCELFKLATRLSSNVAACVRQGMALFKVTPDNTLLMKDVRGKRNTDHECRHCHKHYSLGQARQRHSTD